MVGIWVFELVKSGIMMVKLDWIDYNGYFNMVYYNVFFDMVVDEVFYWLDFGFDYVKECGVLFFIVEVYVCYVCELSVDVLVIVIL